jgi:glycine oxidase
MTASGASPEVVVVGGGVTGCAVAYELVQAGARVTLVERDSVAAHASGFSWGGLYPTMGAGIPGPLLEPSKRSLERHIELHDRLIEEAGVDNELRPVESISLAKDASDLESLRADCVWQRSQGFDAEMISDGEVYELEPSLVPGLAGGLLQPRSSLRRWSLWQRWGGAPLASLRRPARRSRPP